MGEFGTFGIWGESFGGFGALGSKVWGLESSWRPA